MCGIGHGIMQGRLVVQSDADYQQWLQQRTPSP
jgi:heme/copper-type cytochrome/quinol oxidase subunit 2